MPPKETEDKEEIDKEQKKILPAHRFDDDDTDINHKPQCCALKILQRRYIHSMVLARDWLLLLGGG